SVARHLSHRTALVGGFRFALLWRNASEARTYSETSVDQDPAFVERIRAGEITDGPGMRDQAGSFTPKMQLESGRFHHESRLRVVGQIQRHLMRGTGACRGDAAAKAGDDRSMQVSGNNALDLRVARDDRLQCVGLREP